MDAVTVTLDGNPAEELTLQGVEISYGRQDVTAQPEATTCSMSLLYESSLGSLDPDTLRIGTPLEVYVGTERRFAGVVTDVEVDRNTAQLVAVSPVLSRLGRYTAPTVPATTGTTGTALAAGWNAFQNAYSTPPALDASTGTVTVDVDAQSDVGPLEWLAPVIASEPAGVLFERISTGEIVFRDSDDRRTIVPAYTFTGDTTSIGWRFARRIAEKVNTVSVTWTGGTVDLDDATDVAAAGVYQTSLETVIDNETDATTAARFILRNQTVPGWQLDALPVGVAVLDSLDQAALAALEVGSVVEIPEILPGFQTLYFVEGYTERIGRDLWELELYLSDVSLSRPADRWVDVGAGVTWAGMNQTLTWDDVLKEPVA